jgi:hypothetical protein
MHYYVLLHLCIISVSQVSGKTDDIKEFVSDVMTHGADLKFLTISGQKFVQLSKVSHQLHTFLTLNLAGED